MSAFGIFWTSVALRLSAAPFDLGSKGIALFALAGAAGAIIAPLAGWAGDLGWTRGASFVAHSLVIAGAALAGLSGTILSSASMSPAVLLGLMAAGAVLLDSGVIADQALGRRAINMASAGTQGRMNGLFTALMFVGSAVGAAMTGILWLHFGWSGICGAAAAFGVTAFSLHSILDAP